MRVALWGYYGFNYGDDVMMYVILDQLTELNYKITLVDCFSGHLAGQVKKRYPHIDVVPLKQMSKPMKLLKVYQLARSSLNIWGGGTIFTNVDGNGNHRFFSLIKRFGGKYGYVGIGIGDLTIEERINKAKYLLKNSSLTIFRESASLERAYNLTGKNIKYYVAEDLSYLYFQDEMGNLKDSIDEQYVLVTWRNLKRYMDWDIENKRMNQLIEVIKVMMKNQPNLKIKLMALDTNHDIESCNILVDKFKGAGVNVEFDEDSSIANITQKIRHAYFHFSGRLHGSVASEVFHVPTLSLSYSPKMDYFYQSIGSSNYMNIYKDDISIDRVNDLLSNTSKSSFVNHIRESKLNIDYLKTIVQ